MKGRYTVPILAVLQDASLFSGQLEAQSDVNDFSIQMFLIQEAGISFPFQSVRYINWAGKGYTLS